MKLKFKLLVGLLFVFGFNLYAQDSNKLALVGVKIFNGKLDDSLMTVIIEDEIIIDIFKSGTKSISDSTEKIQLKNFFLLPSFIDTHVHMQMKGLNQSPDDARKEFRRWIYSGVTAVREMGGDARSLSKENQRIQDNIQVGPDIYFSATVGSSDQIKKDLRLKNVTKGVGIERAGYIIEAKEEMIIEQAITNAVESGVTGIKFYTGVEADLIEEISEEAHKQGLKTWSHFTVFPDRPIEVIKAGVDVVSHVWGAFWQDNDVDPSETIPFTDTDFKGARSAIIPKDLNVLNIDSQELQELFEEMVERNTIWDLTYVIPNPKNQEIYKKYAIAGSEAGVSFSTGTDYFNDINEEFPALYKEIIQLVKDGIMDTSQAIESATINGAKVIGIEDTHGSIEVGKKANLIVLRESPIDDIENIKSIELTMKNGKVFYRKDY